MPASHDAETLPIGVLGRPHGLRGELTLRPHNLGGRDLGGVRELLLERAGGREERRLHSIRPGAGGWLIKLVGVDSRTDAEALTNVPVRVRRDALPPLEAGEFFVADTVGCQVRTEEGRPLGVVADVFWNGAHDVMIIDGAEGGELLIPAVGAFVRSVDATARIVVVVWDGEEEGQGEGKGQEQEEEDDGP